MKEFVIYIFSPEFCVTCIIITIATLVWVYLNNALEKHSGRLLNDPETDENDIKILQRVVLLLYAIIVLLIIAGVNGFDITAAVAGLGIVGVIGTFVAQDLMKDIIVGIDIYVNHYFKPGEYIYKVENGEERVLKVTKTNLKVTKFYEERSDDTITYANRLITDAQIFSGSADIKIPFPYDLPLSVADEMFDKMIERIKKIDTLEHVDVVGIDEMTQICSKRRIRTDGAPETFWKRKGDTLHVITEVFEEYGVMIPSARALNVEMGTLGYRDAGDVPAGIETRISQTKPVFGK